MEPSEGMFTLTVTDRLFDAVLDENPDVLAYQDFSQVEPAADELGWISRQEGVVVLRLAAAEV